MSRATCPSCSSTFKTKPEWAGRQVRCPQCSLPLRLGADTDAEEGFADNGPGGDARWVILGGAVVISLAVGVAVGFVVGHQKGRADNVRDIADAKSTAESAILAKKDLEADLASAVAERKRDKERFETEVKDRDTRLASAREAEAEAKALVKLTQEKLAAAASRTRREAEEKAEADAAKKKIAAIPLTDERKRKSQIDAEYVERKLSSTNRVILKAMAILMGFNHLCNRDDVTKEAIARVVGDDRDLIPTAARMLTDVGSYIPSSSKKGLTLQESWDICVEALGVKK